MSLASSSVNNLSWSNRQPTSFSGIKRRCTTDTLIYSFPGRPLNNNAEHRHQKRQQHQAH